MTRRWGLVAAGSAAAAGLAIATLGVGAGSSAGKPTKQPAILCGLWVQSDSTENVSGNSNQDHFNGADVSGGQYYSPDATHQKCQDEYKMDRSGTFQPGTQTFTWKINHSNVDVQRERGTEHGQFVLSGSSAWEAGFQGQISEFDFATAISAPNDPTDNGTITIYYVSGRPDGAGNFNTHGGAATGQHYRGNYGTIVYQDDNNSNSPCPKGKSNYCFQALLDGFVN